VSAFPDGSTPLFAWDSLVGMVQRFGMFGGVAAVVVGEFWFASAVGRVGAALEDGKPAGRSTRYMMLLGLVVIGLVGSGALAPGRHFGFWAQGYDARATEEFPDYDMKKPLVKNPAYEVGNETNKLAAGKWDRNVGGLIDQAGTFKTVIPPAACLLVGLIVWLMHLRMVGAARGAMAGWLDAHGNAA
jgi:hypothetical protein